MGLYLPLQQLLWAAFLVHSSTGKLPNFVLFFADDMGYGDVGCYGHPTILTPNIDNLARNGMNYSAYPICTPSRSGLLTGRLPVRSGIYTSHDWPLDMVFRVFMPISEGGLPETEVTIPQVLKRANYTSALVGKWHLGHVDCLPTQRGFDEFYGLPYAQDEGCPPNCGVFESDWHGVPLYDGLTIIEQPVNLSTLTPRYNAKALDFIDRNKDNPFFLMMSYDEVHVPLFASNSFLNTSRRGLYGDAAQEMDASVGVVMKKLKDLGLEENTLVIFTRLRTPNHPYTQYRQSCSERNEVHAVLQCLPNLYSFQKWTVNRASTSPQWYLHQSRLATGHGISCLHAHI
jgi:hypothetical protein